MSWTALDLPDLSGRVAVVTGANSGLGLECSRALAGAGARVVLAVRDLAKGEAARTAVVAAGRGSAEVVPLDLASLASVREAAVRILDTTERIDLLLNNAGVMATPARRTQDGFELQLGTAVFGHYAFTARLWPAIERSGSARIVSVTSFARLTGAPYLDPGDLLMRRYDPWRAYGRSKLGVAVLGLELHRRLAANGRSEAIASLVAHPGYANTNLQATTATALGDPLSRFFARSVRTVGMTPEQGARPLLRAAADPGARSGEMYAPRFVAIGPAVRRPIDARTASPSAGKVLWRVCREQTGAEIPV